MNPLDQVRRLESLLERIRHNVTKPRIQARPPAPAPEPVSMPLASAETSGVIPVPSAGFEQQPRHEATPRSLPEVALAPPAPEAIAVAVEQDLAPVVELNDEEIVEIDVDEVEEIVSEPPPPSSSRRPKAASSMDEALAGAAAELEREHEVPLKTPPPESGRQIAAPAVGELRHSAPPADLLEADIEPPAAQRLPIKSELPTAEQIGQTVELVGERSAAELELGTPIRASERPGEVVAPDDLEASLPSNVAASAYSEDLAPPSMAREELERHRQQERIVIEPAEPAALDTEDDRSVVARGPVVAGAPVAVVLAARPTRAKTFLELLDAALSLGQK